MDEATGFILAIVGAMVAGIILLAALGSILQGCSKQDDLHHERMKCFEVTRDVKCFEAAK